jgi:hypothetical protein
MKKEVLFYCSLCFLFLILQDYAGAFELRGLQPIQPYGVFSNFSADTMKAGTFAAGTDYERAIDDTFHRLTLKAGFGISDDAEVLASFPYVLGGSDVRDGFEDFALGFQHRIFHEFQYGPSIAYLLKASLPTGNDQNSSGGSVGGGLIISKKIGPFSSNINFFYSEPFKSSYNEQIELSVGLGLKAAHDFDILAELYCLDSFSTKSFDTVEARFGYRIKTADYLYTLIGVGYDLKNRDPEYRFMLSFNLIFDKSRSIGY